MSTQARSRVSLLVLCCVVGLAVIPAGVQAATSPCSSQHKSYFDGAKNTALNGTWGSRARIDSMRPALCGSGSISTAWAMITARSSSGTNRQGWAQVGYGLFGDASGYSGGFKVFAQYTLWCYSDTYGCAAGYPVTKYGGAVPSDPGVMKNAYNSQGGREYMWAWGVQIASTDFDPVDHWVAAWRADFSAETFECETDTVGLQGDKASFVSLSKETDSSGNNWAAITATTSEVNCASRYRYGEPTQGSTDFNVWTTN